MDKENLWKSNKNTVKDYKEYEEDPLVAFLETQKHVRITEPGKYSDEYLKFVSSLCVNPELTNTQHQFAEFLLLVKPHLEQIGELEAVFKMIRKYVKHKK